MSDGTYDEDRLQGWGDARTVGIPHTRSCASTLPVQFFFAHGVEPSPPVAGPSPKWLLNNGPKLPKVGPDLAERGQHRAMSGQY